MSLLSRWLGFQSEDCELAERQAATEAAIIEERGKLNNHVQTIQSGSRVLKNMAGAMRIQNLSNRLDRE